MFNERKNILLDERHTAEVKARLNHTLQAHGHFVYNSNPEKFQSIDDAILRLIPFHLWEYAERRDVESKYEKRKDKDGLLIERSVQNFKRFKQIPN